MDIVKTLCSELGKSPEHVSNVIELIDGGSTIPFIARYRKELHGGMDDTSLRKLAERLEYLRGLDERKTAVLGSIEAQGKLTEELRAEIDSAETLARLEDIYRPFRPKKRTRAQIAREKGLEPLAAAIMLQGREAPEELAERFLSEREAVSASADAGSAASASAAASAPAANLEPLTVEEALAGARDIIAEMISDDAASREKLRSFIGSHAKLRSEALRDEDSVYRL
ncbi:MAG: hypothetical protein II173_02455, partial [Firmicutes bacterium]|nr:hypothetical protein [Bacillota bacterium]